VDFTRRTGVSVTRYDAQERYLNRNFQYSTNGASFYASWVKWLYIAGSYTQGGGVNYYPPAGMSPFVGTTRNASFTLKVRPRPRLRIEETYYHSQLASRWISDRIGERGAAFNDHLSRTLVNYQFSRALSLRAILDYDGLLANPPLFGGETTKRLTGDLLLTYLLNPGTALYVGVNSGYENLYFGSRESAVNRWGGPTYLTGRQVFVKLTYRLRL
jgi:hypothetical protein